MTHTESGGAPVDVSDASFQTDVLPAIRLCWLTFGQPGADRARWSHRCWRRSPPKHAGQLTVAKLDVDANPETARNFDVVSIPTLILFKDGEPVKRIVGAKGKAALLRELSDAVPNVG